MTRDRATLSWPVQTERLVIRPATEDDLDATWAFRQLPGVGEWLSRIPANRDDYAEQFLAPNRLAKTLVVELDGEVIGDLMFSVEDAWGQVEVEDRAKGSQAEIGWVISPHHAGQGFATEGASELLRICFDELELRRVFAQCFADNTASWRLMERLGMRREEHAVAESLHRSRGWVDSFRYAILEYEWRGRRTKEE